MSYRNAIVVVVDALRADRVGAIDGGTLTPNIDRLASDGTAFTRSFTCSPNTDPSVTAIHTGRYPRGTVYHHGRLVTDAEKRAVAGAKPLPAVLGEAGYRTAAVGNPLGRWHSRGYDVYPGDEADPSSDVNLSDRLVQTAYAGYRRVDETLSPVGAAIRQLYRTLIGGSRPLATLQQEYDPTDVLDHVQDEPFFGFVHLMDTHMPYSGTDETARALLEERSYGHGPLEEFLAERELTSAQEERLRSYADRLGTDSLDRILAQYDAAVRRADEKVGALLDRLRGEGPLDIEDTVVIVTSDHGESLLEDGIFLDHHGLHDPVFRVPLVTNVGQGRVSDELVQETDIAPTVLDLLDIDDRPPADGRTDEWKLVAYEEDATIVDARGSARRCGYCDTVHGDGERLYRVTEDGTSRRVDSGDIDVVEQLWEAYEDHIDGLVESSGEPADVTYDDEGAVLERLEALGYK
jgi:arylsulfatase A-like enzyme